MPCLTRPQEQLFVFFFAVALGLCWLGILLGFGVRGLELQGYRSIETRCGGGEHRESGGLFLRCKESTTRLRVWGVGFRATVRGLRPREALMPTARQHVAHSSPMPTSRSCSRHAKFWFGPSCSVECCAPALV